MDVGFLTFYDGASPDSRGPAMKLPHVRISVRRMMILVAVLAVLLAVVIPVGRLSHYASVRRQMYDSISALQYRAPQGGSPSAWECASGWTVTAYTNVCFSEEHVTIGEMYRLREDL